MEIAPVSPLQNPKGNLPCMIRLAFLFAFLLSQTQEVQADLSLVDETLVWEGQLRCPIMDVSVEAELTDDQLETVLALLDGTADPGSAWDKLLSGDDLALQRIYIHLLASHWRTSEAEKYLDRLLEQTTLSVDEYATLVIDKAWVMTRASTPHLGAVEDVIRPFIRGLENTGQTHSLSPDLWVALGDWLLILANRKETRIAYASAWEGFEERSAGSAAEYFDEPSIICDKVVLSRDLVNDYDGSRGEIIMSFRADINKKGRPRAMKLLQDHEDAFPIQSVVAVARTSRFRPAMRDGELVKTDDFEFERIVYPGAR